MTGHEWLLDVLVGQKSAVAWASAGLLPPGYERAEQLAVLSAGGGRSFLLPVAARSGTVSALTSYNALRPLRRRLARRGLALGIRAGLAQMLLRGRIDIGTAGGTTAAELADVLVTEHLAALFGTGQVAVAISGGSGGPYRKPVLQVFGLDGKPLGYVKVGWNDWTRNAVRREAATLRACAGRRTRFGVPALLDCHEWRGLDLLVTAPLPAGVRRLERGSSFPAAELAREISELSPRHAGELAASPWWLGLRARAQATADTNGPEILAAAMDRVESELGDVRLEFGTWHGDLVPWNAGQLGRRVYVWDWEDSAPDVPLGFDVLHSHFQTAFVMRRRPLDEAVASAARSAGPGLTELGVAPDGQRLIAILHLLELYVRHEEASRGSGEIDGRFYPAASRVLEQWLAVPAGQHLEGRAA